MADRSEHTANLALVPKEPINNNYSCIKACNKPATARKWYHWCIPLTVKVIFILGGFSGVAALFVFYLLMKG